MSSESILTVFYSWESDLPRETNQDFLRTALHAAAANLRDSEKGGIQVDIDEATRDRPGSPNIPSSIFEKISDADIFVCDVTIINNSDTNERFRVPNPNVLIELGYAIAVLGWSRIVMVFNKAFGDLGDLPFDIRQHRVTPYTQARLEGSKRQAQSASAVFGRTLATAFEIIHRSSPKRPNEINGIALKSTAAIPDVRVKVDAGIRELELHGRAFALFLQVQNHSPVPVKINSLYFETRNPGSIAVPNGDYLSGEYQRPRKLQPGRGFTLSLDPAQLEQPWRDDRLLCAVAKDEIGRMYRSTEADLSLALDILFTQYLGREPRSKSQKGDGAHAPGAE
jgi:hypothetical protein